MPFPIHKIRSHIKRGIQIIQICLFLTHHNTLFELQKLEPAFPLQESPTILVHNQSAPLSIEEKILALRHIRFLDTAWATIYPCKDTCGREQLQRIPHANLAAVLCDLLKCWVSDVDVFDSRAQPDDGLDLFGVVGLGGDDEESSEEIRRDTMRCGDVVGATDDSVAAVRGEDDDGRDGGFESPVQVSEAFDVEHVNLG